MATGFIQHTFGHLCKLIPLELTSISTTCSGSPSPSPHETD